MKRRSVSVVMATAMLASVLFGCGGGDSDQKAENSTGQASQENTENEISNTSGADTAGDVSGTKTAANPEDLTGTVVIWDWDGGTQQKYVDKFNEVYPNVNIEVQDLSLIHI